MAEADSITTTPQDISGCFGMPKIQIPNNFDELLEDAKGYFYFEIRTPKGTVKAFSYRGDEWECLGTVDALAAGGFLRPEWCPGLPGNNKTRQTVIFKDGRAWLIYGNRASSNLDLPHIVIKRASAKKFYVELPATKEQQERLSQAIERREQRAATKLKQKEQIKKRQDKEERYSEFHRSPSIFKDDASLFLKRIFNGAMEDLSGRYEFSEYGETTIWVDEGSMQDILSAGARLFEAIRAAKVVCRKKELHLSIVK
jgi:hypothetical protein